ncbi:hypothetical protein KKA24_01985 [Patescibacteria group bacterium]|nr:hypothetical protein [Patescibacteria group bacterium]
MDIEKKFRELFDLVRRKAHNPDEVIYDIQGARIDISKKIKKGTKKEIRIEIQEHRDLMGLLCKIPENDRIQKRTINLLIVQAMKENRNGQKHS